MRFTLAKTHSKIQLGQELGRGGEGTVFAIEGRSDQVAKLYSIPPELKKTQKLLRMAEVANPSLLKIAAWPVDLVMDTSGRSRGFIMPRVSARRDIHELYGPKSRAEAFPAADFRFLVHVAANIARALAVVHEQGHVIGDLNHGNILVGPDGTVMLIDCDSFQLRNGEHLYTCDVGVPLFTAPELHGLPFRGLERTANHDLFGLAVVLFHLLFMGRHPFAGRYSGATEMPIERAIREYRFAYGPDRSLHGMERPPDTISLETMGSAVSSLFISSFGRDGSSTGRPKATTWVRALEQLKGSLRLCPMTPSHYFPNISESCPWCIVEQKTGVQLFGQRVVVPDMVGAVDVATLWQLIISVKGPDPDPPLPSKRPPLPGSLHVRRAIKIIRQSLAIGIVMGGIVSCVAVSNVGIFLAPLSYGLAYAVWPRPSPQKLAEADQVLAAARMNWESALASWTRQASRAEFEAEVKQLKKLHDEIIDMPNERRRRLLKLEEEREIRQKNRYLDRFRIDRANIRGIGPSRTAMLAAYGVETAADIDQGKILGIPGFGFTLARDLQAWRRLHERNFRLNPNDPDHQRDVDAVIRDLEVRKQSIVIRLRQAPSALRRMTQEIHSARPRLIPVLYAKWDAFKIAEVYRSAL